MIKYVPLLQSKVNRVKGLGMVECLVALCLLSVMISFQCQFIEASQFYRQHANLHQQFWLYLDEINGFIQSHPSEVQLNQALTKWQTHLQHNFPMIKTQFIHNNKGLKLCIFSPEAIELNFINNEV